MGQIDEKQAWQCGTVTDITCATVQAGQRRTTHKHSYQHGADG